METLLKNKKTKMLLDAVRTDNYRMESLYSIEEIIKRGVQPQVLEAVVNRGFLNPETFEMDLSDIKSDEDINLLIDFYIGTIFNSSSETELILNIYEQEVPESFEPILTLLSEKVNPYFKYDDMFFNIHITEFNQIVTSYLGKKFEPEEDDYCIELSK